MLDFVLHGGQVLEYYSSMPFTSEDMKTSSRYQQINRRIDQCHIHFPRVFLGGSYFY